VTPQYGVGQSRIDFAAAHPRFPSRMVLAIEADGASYHSSHTARDRDRLRQQALEKLGWKFHRIWSTDWFTDPDSEVAKVRAAYDRAVRNSDNANAEATQ
jgi:very-short-patch-repair endonuclease